jgi:hypothetical protein
VLVGCLAARQRVTAPSPVRRSEPGRAAAHVRA